MFAMSAGRKFRATVLSGAVLAGSLLAAPAASAAPYNCSVNGTGLSRSAICYQGSGSYRIKLLCVAPLGDTTRNVNGPYMSMSSGTPSVASCNWLESVGGANVGTID